MAGRVRIVERAGCPPLKGRDLIPADRQGDLSEEELDSFHAFRPTGGPYISKREFLEARWRNSVSNSEREPR